MTNTHSNFPGGFANGVTLRNMPILNTYGHQVFYVHSPSGGDGNKGTFARPLASVDAAFALCTANRGDIIIALPGHAETISTATGFVMDKAGVSVVGMGRGIDMPEITFSATAALIAMDQPNCALVGFRLICAVASQTIMVDINADDCEIAFNEFVESSATGLTGVDINGGAANACDRAYIHDNTFRMTTAGNWDRAIELAEVQDGVVIERNDIVGDFDDAAIHNPTGKVMTNLVIRNNYVRNNQAGQHAIELVSACTGTAYDNRMVTDVITTAFDAGALSCMGNLWNVTTGGDTEGVPVNPEAVATTSALGKVDTAAATGAVTSTDYLMAYVKQLVTQNGIELDTDTLGAILYGSGGIATFPAAAAAGNGVSMAEVLRYVQDVVAGVALNRNSTNYLGVTADFTSATWNTVAAHEILTVTGAAHIIILPEVKGTITSAGGTATLILGDETTTNSLITSSDAEGLAVGEWWFDATVTRTLAASSIFRALDFVVANGKDIGYTIGTEALTGGSILFHVWWEPIDATGAVAAGAGGAL